MERYRIENVKDIKKKLLAVIPCICFLVIGSFSHIPFLIFLLCLPVLFFIGGAYQSFIKMSSHLKRQFKIKIMPELLKFLFADFEYIANQRIAKSVIEKSMIFSKHIAIAEGEDFMRFKLGETTIMFCETTAYSNSEKIIFQGIFISASFNKNFSSKTFVLPVTFSTYFQSIKRRLLDNFQMVKLEDVEFDKEFIVFSTDQIGARYVLTTSLMNRLLDYKRKIKKKISFSFVDNRLYCAIPNYLNLFEPALFEPFDFDLIKKSYNPLKIYTDIVEDLNLNLRIWTKQ